MLLILIFAFFIAPAVAIDSEKCQVSGNATLDECFESFTKKWEDLRKDKPHIDALVFPILAMTADDLKSLCSRIDQAKDQCGNATETCDTHEISRFVQQNFAYGCRHEHTQSLFADQSECLLSTITGQQQCLMLLKRSDEEPSNPCSQVEQFFKCIHEEVFRYCQAKGLAGLVHAIDKFGCDIKKLDARVGNAKNAVQCEPFQWQEVASCFQPLFNFWSEIRDNDTSLLNTAFPVFKFARSDIVRMCDLVKLIRDKCFVQIQRCPGHQLPEFVNAILGLACGTQQSAFFLSHDCIRTTIEENDQCHPYAVGTWQPGHLKEICTRMPSYYKCLERPITSKCSNDAVDVLAQAIRQYGCELHTDPSQAVQQAAVPESTTTTTTIVQTTTVSTLKPITEGVLDFAASPPSHAEQAPSPSGPLGSQSSLPFLAESQLQPTFLIGSPAAPLLIAPPADTLNNPESQPLPKLSPEPAPPASILAENASIPTPATFTLEQTTSSSTTTTGTSTPTTTTGSTSSSTVATTTKQKIAPTSTSTPKGVVVPIPTVPHLLGLCNLEKRNKLRECLSPLYKRWVDVHARMLSTQFGLNLTFPIYHYEKEEVVELCDNYASAFVKCSFNLFEECLVDDVVYLANAVFGYACSPKNMTDFTKHFECIANVVGQRGQCSSGIQGTLLMVSDQQTDTRCLGAREFYSCNRREIEQICGQEGQQIFRETVRQFGCQLNN